MSSNLHNYDSRLLENGSSPNTKLSNYLNDSENIDEYDDMYSTKYEKSGVKYGHLQLNHIENIRQTSGSPLKRSQMTIKIN